MKKYLSFVLSATLSISALTSTAVFAESTKSSAPNVNSIVFFGDSIARGYGLEDGEYTYAQLCKDYFGCNVDNFASDGLDSYELMKALQRGDEDKKQAIENSEVVVISIGGNDIIHRASKQTLNFAAKKGLLKEGYTADDIPEDPGAYAMKTMIDLDAFKDYAKSGLMASLELNTELKAFSMNLRLSEGNNAYGQNEGVIKNQIIPNISESVKAIKEINPDAQVIVQTIYQPFQFSPEYVAENYGESGYSTFITTIRSDFNLIMDTFREELKNVEDIEIVDVLQTFTGLESLADSCDVTPGYAYYFTDIQEPMEAEEEGGKTMDFHPNQKGHIAIASDLINQIKVKDKSTGEFVKPAPAKRDIDPETGKETSSLIVQTIDSIDNIEKCPPLVMGQIVVALPEKLTPGDINDDGYVDAGDGGIILDEYAHLSTNDDSILTAEQKQKADINYDRYVDATDATYALMYYAYLSTLPTSEEPLDIFGYMHKINMDYAKNK